MVGCRVPLHGIGNRHGAQREELDMSAILAVNAVDGRQSAFEVITAIFSNGDALAQPQQLVEALGNLSLVWAVVFLIVGVLCLFNGYRYYKATTVILALLIGAFAGYALGKQIGAQWIVAGCLAALLATLCFPLMKYAVAVLGGLTGAYIGANVWSACAQLFAEPGQVASNAEHYWIGALIGLIVLGMLAFIVFKLSVIVFTSISGSSIAVMGFLALLLQLPSFSDGVASGVKAHAAVIPILVIVPAVIGLILQGTSSHGAKDVGAAA